VFVICDEADFVREKAIKLTEEIVSKYEPISVDSIARLIEVLLGRLNAIPYPETSE
jgi:predicted Holliday junction resolvase-like endonuclease